MFVLKFDFLGFSGATAGDGTPSGTGTGSGGGGSQTGTGTAARPAANPFFAVSAGRKGEWSGDVPARGAVFCEFVAPAFEEMEDNEGLFNLRLAGGRAEAFHGIGAILRKQTGRIGFGARPVSGLINYADGPSFHPGRTHRLFLSYDLVRGDVSVMLDGGSVFSAGPGTAWTPASANKVLLWEHKFSGSAAPLSRGASRIQLFDAGELPA